MRRIKLNILLSFLHVLAYMPFSVLYVLSDIIYFVLYRVGGYRRKVVRDNLRNSFPEKSREELKDIERRFYHHLSDCIVEDIKLLHVSDQQLHERIEMRNTELIEQLSDDGGSIFLLLGHYANWEWVQKITWHYSRPTLNYIIYRPIKDPVIDEIFIRIRSRFPTIPLPQKQVVRTLLEDRRAGRQCVIAFISDQRPNSKNLNHWTTFLSQDTAYAVGAEEIGRRIGAHYLYLEVEKTHRGHYVVTVKEISPSTDTTDYPYTNGFMHMMEATIKNDPAYWLWTHKRWRIKREIQTNT